ncbi:MAG: trypsin-like peptidase domain-containing protein, partial [Nitrospira sp.]|nr:trypsin-like peptidase domain-containing protein [Nitrospira sp.]
KGTGILIGPNLVLTAWHVVSSLFEPALEPTQRDRFLPNSKAQSRITVIFDDLTGILDGRLEKARPTSYDAHVDWCAAHSECHPAELKQTLPPDLKELNGFWDYAVLRLAKTPGLERLWAALDDRAVVPPAKERMVLFQHPAGQPMRCDSSVLVKPDGTYADAIPHLRFLHQANAVGGSSGGPCFDRQFMFFGLHQGVWQKPEDGVEGANRGVPITQIKQHIAQKIPNFPVPDPAETPVWKRLTTDPDFPGGPIIGCDAFQSLLWKSAIKGSPKFIVINGPEGSGKSFRLTVLSAMLPDSGHLKLCLRAEAISKFTALDLAKEVCKTAGAQVPNFVQAEDFHSSVNAWVRDELVQKVVQALDVARSGRLVWITIADLNRSAIQGDLASDFLLSLYDQVRTVEWLRIVLDDMKGDVLSTIRNVMEYHRVEYVTRDDTETYLNRAFAEFGVMPEGLPNFARYAFWEYQESLNKGAVLPMAGLSNQLFNFVEVLFRK